MLVERRKLTGKEAGSKRGRRKDQRQRARTRTKEEQSENKSNTENRATSEQRNRQNQKHEHPQRDRKATTRKRDDHQTERQRGLTYAPAVAATSRSRSRPGPLHLFRRAHWAGTTDFQCRSATDIEHSGMVGHLRIEKHSLGRSARPRHALRHPEVVPPVVSEQTHRAAREQEPHPRQKHG